MIIKASWLSNCLTSPPFFPLLFSFWWAALSQLSGLLQLWIIHVTRHYLDGVNNWNLCLKGFDVDERKGNSGRAGGRLRARVPGCQAGDTSHVNRFWLTSPDGRPSLLGGRRLWLESEHCTLACQSNLVPVLFWLELSPPGTVLTGLSLSHKLRSTSLFLHLTAPSLFPFLSFRLISFPSCSFPSQFPFSLSFLFFSFSFHFHFYFHVLYISLYLLLLFACIFLFTFPFPFHFHYFSPLCFLSFLFLVYFRKLCFFFPFHFLFLFTIHYFLLFALFLFSFYILHFPSFLSPFLFI